MLVLKDGGDSTFAPSYFSPGLMDQLNQWIQGGSEEQTFFQIKINSMMPLGVKVEKGIYLKLTTKGVSKFNFNVGWWYETYLQSCQSALMNFLLGMSMT